MGSIITIYMPTMVKGEAVLAHEDELQDSLTMKYWILTDGSENFSGVEE
jgi:hypothetical protein